MPPRMSDKDLDELEEDLLKLRNVLIDLRTEKYAGAASRAERAIRELRAIIREQEKA